MHVLCWTEELFQRQPTLPVQGDTVAVRTVQLRGVRRQPFLPYGAGLWIHGRGR